MRNTHQYPVTFEEMIEACEYASQKLLDEKPMTFGGIRPYALKRAAIHLKRLQFAALENEE